MQEITISGLVQEFEVGKPILNGFAMTIFRGERVGLVGKNGAGKTTLFRIITDEIGFEQGNVAVARDRTIGLISQIPRYPAGYTVTDVLKTAFAPIFELERTMTRLSEQMKSSDAPKLLRQYGEAAAAFEFAGGYEMDTRLAKVCNGLGIPQAMQTQSFDTLSGGEKSRVNLARLILEETDILLLDEPTNHLDLSGIEWLEEFLKTYQGTVLAISHDRYFLDLIVNRIVEVEGGKAEEYAGNYSYYVVEKQRRYEEKLKQYEIEQAKIAQLTAAADKMHLWAFMGNDKLHKRAFAMEKRAERIRKTERPTKDRKLTMGFGEVDFRGDDLIKLRDLSKGFDGRSLFENVTLEIGGGDRLGIIGDNGTGKTTLLKILLGEEEPDGGSIKLGPTVKIGYLPQVVRFSHPERTMLDTLIYDTDCSAQTARNRLAAFGFRGEDVFKPVSVLSGGEQSRLRLCLLMDEKINVLVLDEPTNHLDLNSREWIESAVESFEGTLIFVSHDRYFISRFAERLLIVEQGDVTDFDGVYEQYKARQERQAAIPAVEDKPKKSKQDKPKGGTKLLEKELRQVERDMEKWEQRLVELGVEVEANATDYQRLDELLTEQRSAKEELDVLFNRWAELTEELESQWH